MKKILLLVCFAFLGLLAFAQPNISGKWRFGNQEAISGTLYANGSPLTLIVKQDEQSITIERTSMGADRNATVAVETIYLGGKITETKASDGSPKVLNATWTQDKRGLILESIIYSSVDKSKKQRKITDTYTIDNGRLLLQRKSENYSKGEVWESKAWYEKVN